MMTTTERTLQERYNAVHDAIMAGPNHQLQEWIDSGLAWHLEGHVGHTASAALSDGACVLSAGEPHKDFYGNTVPTYVMVADAVGSPGSVANAEAFQEAEYA
jgi:hypothetical protein